MNKEAYQLLEQYMQQCMQDSAHDREHVYRVLYTALDIAATEPAADWDVLIAACLLHDIGRKEQFENPALCHAQVGAEKAYIFLTENSFSEPFAAAVKHCIGTHRFRGNNPPESLEAKILFDADKIDATGTLGIARTLVYNGKEGEPLYRLDSTGKVSDGTSDSLPSFFQEYKFKLEKLYARFYTARGQILAAERRQTAVSFYNDMLREVRAAYTTGQALLEKSLETSTQISYE